MKKQILSFILVGVLVACPTPPPSTVYHALTVNPPVQGSINGVGIACGSSCNANLAKGTAVTLTAVPDVNSSFIEWTGACAGQSNPCAISMDSAITVGAIFGAIKGSFTPELEDASLLLPEGVESLLRFKLNRVDGFDVAVSSFAVVATGKYLGSADVQVAVRVLPVQDNPDRLVLGFKAPQLGFNNPASFSATLSFKAAEVTKTIPVVLTVVPCTSGC